MPRLTFLMLQAAILATPLAAQAQDWRDSEVGRGFERAPRVYWDGQCRVTQRINSDGELVERRRCRGDGAAHARAARADDDRDVPRYADDDRPPRYDDRRYSGRYADEAPERRRDIDRDSAPVYAEAEPAPRYLPRAEPAPRVVPRVEPVLRAPRIIAQSVPVAPARVVKPAPVLALIPVKPPAAKLVVKAPAVAAPARKVVAQPAKPVRLAAWVEPGGSATAAAKAKAALVPRIAPVTAPLAPKAARVAAKPVETRLPAKAKSEPVRLAEVKKPVLAKVEPKREAPKAAPAPRVVAARAEPVRAPVKVAPAPRMLAARAEPVRAPVKVAPAPKAVVAVAKVPPRVAVAKAAPAPVKVALAPAAPRVAAVVAAVPELPREVAKPAPAPVVRTAGSKQKSEWLVLLPGEAAKEKVEPKVEAPVNLDNSEPIVQSRVYAKGESYLRSTAYREYVMRKSSDPYSNLK